MTPAVSSTSHTIERLTPGMTVAPAMVENTHIIGDYRITQQEEARIMEDGTIVQLE